VYAGRFASGGGLREVAERVRAAPPAVQPPRADDLLLDGLALLITEGHAAAAAMLKRALSAFASDHLPTKEGVRRLWLAVGVALRLWDDESWDVLTARQVQLARDAGALGVLPIALSQRAGLRVHEGDLTAAAALIEDAGAITEATSSELPPYGSLALAAFRGRELQTSELIETSIRDVVRRGEGTGLTFVRCSTTASVATRMRWPRRSAPTRTRTSSCSHCGRRSS
jgi:hypothetical protein